MNMTPSQDQENALDFVMQFLADPKEEEMAISGPAGTGKTVLTNWIVDRARNLGLLRLLTSDYIEKDVWLTSTTNKAAKVLWETTGEPTMTIHSLLKLKVINDFMTGKTKLQRTDGSDVIQNAIIIVDEASMIDESLLKMIRAMTFECKVIYIGDEYQLAPVFETSCPVFREVKNQVKLTHIQRQVAGSPIIQFADGFRNALDTGEFPAIQSHGNAVQLLPGADFQTKIDEHFASMGHVNSDRVVAWTNERVHQYNDYIRHFHFSDKAPQLGEQLLTNQPIIVNGSITYSIDQIATVTDVWEDDLHDIQGWKVELDQRVKVFQAKERYEVKHLIKRFAAQKDWPMYFAAKEQFADLRPIYSNTVNKSQGSTYDTVFIDVTNIGKNNKNSDLARLMYVATTRASQQVYLTGKLPSRVYG